MPTRYHVIVIGAGVMGSAAAYHLAQAGRRVLLLEQFALGHTNGSSHGESRIIRYAHDDPDYAQLMPATFALWRRLEQESGEQLMQITGGLYIGPPADAYLANTQATLHALSHPYQLWTGAEMQRIYPQFRLPADWLALEQEHSGILAASRCVATLARQAIRHGTELREQTQVITVQPDGDGVVVQVAGPAGAEMLYADQAVITAGPWAKRLLQPLIQVQLPLQVTHQQVVYFPVTQPDLYAVGRCPLYLFTADPYFYGFPIYEEAGHVKIGLEMLNSVLADPEQPRTADAANVEELCTAVAQHLIGIEPVPARIQLCLYTETPNRDFIIDRHPDYPQILFGAGFSGRGFKFAINVGRLLADLAASAPGTYASEFWLDRYAINRFAPVAG